MPEGIPREYQAILDQLHSDVFLNLLKDHLDPVDRSDLNENETSELIELVRRLVGDDVSASVDDEVIQKLLEDDEFRKKLLEATSNVMKSPR